MPSTPVPTQLLIDSSRTDAVKVKSRDGDNIGALHGFMINKRTGAAAYAVMTIGGFMGIGKAFYPIPFALLAFDPGTDCYVVTIDRRVLEGGPSWASNPPLFDQAYADRVASYYGVAGEDLSLS